MFYACFVVDEEEYVVDTTDCSSMSISHQLYLGVGQDWIFYCCLEEGQFHRERGWDRCRYPR